MSKDYGGNIGGTIYRDGRENINSPFLDLDFSKRKTKKLKVKRIKYSGGGGGINSMEREKRRSGFYLNGGLGFEKKMN